MLNNPFPPALSAACLAEGPWQAHPHVPTCCTTCWEQWGPWIGPTINILQPQHVGLHLLQGWLLGRPAVHPSAAACLVDHISEGIT